MTLLGDPGCPPAPDGNPYPQTVLGYQQWHNAAAPKKTGYDKLKEDGKIGPNTRKQLILDYMHREDTTVPAGTPIQVHGCGEFFPLDASEQHVEPNAPDEDEDQRNRRVEVFLFPKELGVLPPVPGEKASKGECEYAEWRRRVVDVELAADWDSDRVEIHLHDSQEKPMPGAPWLLDWGNGTSVDGIADDGWVRITVNRCLPNCTLQWGKAESGDYPYSLKVSLGCTDVAEAQERQKQMLNNMGYDVATSLDAAVRPFQGNSGEEITGLANDSIPQNTANKMETQYQSACRD